MFIPSGGNFEQFKNIGENDYFYYVETNLEHLLVPEFITQFILPESGYQFYAQTHNTPIDLLNCVAIFSGFYFFPFSFDFHFLNQFG